MSKKFYEVDEDEEFESSLGSDEIIELELLDAVRRAIEDYQDFKEAKEDKGEI